MKIFLLIKLLIVLGSISCFASGDTLLIKLKSGETDKIPVSEIRAIKFENITSINDVSNTSIESINYPNPFSDATIIEFQNSVAGLVEIIIYDETGHFVRKLTCEYCMEGKNSIEWDTKNYEGKSVSSGTYIYEIRSGKKVISQKMILIK